MYIGAIIVIIAAGCVFEIFESASERRRIRRNADMLNFPGLSG